jgi:hypothetical protein
LIIDVATDLYPNGWDSVSTPEIMQKVGKRIQDKKLTVPERDVFLRALGRRK